MLDIGVFVAGLAAVGAGVALKDPPSALVAVGGIVIGVVILSRFNGGRK
jgi:hypothetical protein